MPQKGRVRTIRDSFAVIGAHPDRFAQRFYDRLFEKLPTLRSLFSEGMTRQRGKPLNSLTKAVEMFDTPAQLIGPLKKLGAHHADMGVGPGEYQMVVDTLIETLTAEIGDEWDDGHDRAWRSLLDFVSSVMQDGAAEAA